MANGKVVDGAHHGLTGRKVFVFTKVRNSRSWKQSAVTTTNSAGAFRVGFAPATNIDVKMSTGAGGGYQAASASSTLFVTAPLTAQKVTPSVAGVAGDTRLWTAKSTPRLAGTNVYVQVSNGNNTWVNIALAKIGSTGGIRVSFHLRVGYRTYRLLLGPNSLLNGWAPVKHAVHAAAAATQIKTVYPLTDNYRPKAGYTLLHDGVSVCQAGPGVTPSKPSPYGGSAYQACTTPGGNRTCWPDSTATLACMSSPTQSALEEVYNPNLPCDCGLSDRGHGTTITVWEIVLDDGTTCLPITRGGFTIPHATYACDAPGATVDVGLVGPVDRSGRAWSVQYAIHNGPTTHRYVKIAYFAGAPSGHNPLPQ